MTDKCLQYAAVIATQIQDMFNSEECSNTIDINDFQDEQNIKDFFHALATVVPCTVFNRLTGDEKNHLEFNHVANSLCFENMKPEQD